TTSCQLISSWRAGARRRCPAPTRPSIVCRSRSLWRSSGGATTAYPTPSCRTPRCCGSFSRSCERTWRWWRRSPTPPSRGSTARSPRMAERTIRGRARPGWLAGASRLLERSRCGCSAGATSSSRPLARRSLPTSRPRWDDQASLNPEAPRSRIAGAAGDARGNRRTNQTAGGLAVRPELLGRGFEGRRVDHLVGRGDRARVVAHAAEEVEVALQAGAGDGSVRIEPRHVHVLVGRGVLHRGILDENAHDVGAALVLAEGVVVVADAAEIGRHPAARLLRLRQE